MGRIFRVFVKMVAILIVLLLLALPFIIRPVDRTPIQSTKFYGAMMQQLDSLEKAVHLPDTIAPLRAGWAIANITPLYPMPTAGYGRREGRKVLSVHDSLFVRAIYLEQGDVKAAIVTADMLIIPPEVSRVVQSAIGTTGLQWKDLYLGATHSHNSFGGWGRRYVGELFAGKYHQEWVNNVAAQIILAIDKAKKMADSASCEYFEFAAPGFVNNRVLHNDSGEDPVFRMLRFKGRDSNRLVLTSFAAHATTLSDTVLQFSRDYPGILVDSLERSLKDHRAAFLAGAVGTMGPEEKFGANDWEQMHAMGAGLAAMVVHALEKGGQRETPILRILTMPLPMREPQWRFSRNWCFRHWVWKRFYGDYPAEVKALRIGNVVMVGLPCDFGGELMAPLEAYARQRGRQLMVTSFNGGYCGYITPDNRYDEEGYETRVMNWFGPGNGAYFSEVVKRLVKAM